jgi:alpha-tubulin suppressor-like RCC1 family protein
MRFIEIPALITEDIEDPSIVDITEPITVSISGTTMTINGQDTDENSTKLIVSGEATVTLTGDTTVDAFTLQNIRAPSLHKISVKTNNKGNFTYVPNNTVTASSVSTTTKTGSDFEILLITTNGGETYVDFDMADYTSPALYTSNALTGFDISELTSTYGATAKLYKPGETSPLATVSATTGSGVNFGYTESLPGDVEYKLEVTDDLGRKSTYNLPRKWINYAMGTTSTPGFQKFRLEGIDDDYTTTVMFPSLGSSSTAKVYRTSDHGYLGINFKIQGRNSTGDDWVDIANADEDDEVLAFGDFLYHRVWVKPTAKATTTVSSSNVVTLTLSNLTEENVTTSFDNFDPYDINESTNTYVFEETTKIGTVPFTVTLGGETYTNSVTATTEGTAYDYVTLAFANPTLSLTTSNVTISSAKLYRDDVLFHTYGTESNVVLRTDQTGTYQAVVNDVYYSNRVVPDFTTTRSVSAPQLEFDGYNRLNLSNITPTSTTLGVPDGTTRDLTTQSNVYIYETGTYTANVQTSETFAYLSNVVTSQPSQNPTDVGPTFTFDEYNRLAISNLTQTSSTLEYGSNTYDTNTASNVYVTDAGEYKLEARDANTFVMSNVYVGAISTDKYDYSLSSSGQQKITASGGSSTEYFGRRCAISGDKMIVTASSYNSGQGAAYIFTKSGTSWSQQQRLTVSGLSSSTEPQFGHGADISGNYAIVGAYEEDTDGTNAGGVYIYYFSGGTWTQQARIVSSDIAAGDVFGYAVSIDGDYAIVGAQSADPDDLSNAGASYIFKRSGTSWTQQAKLTASDAAEGDVFGRDVAIKGDYAIVGCYSGEAAYIFKKDTGAETWTQKAILTASDASGTAYFGNSVSMSGDYVIVGAKSNDANKGAAYIFKKDTGAETWTQQAKLIANDVAENDEFGWSVSIDNGLAIVGSLNDDDGSSSSGSAYVFARDGAIWSQQVKLTASDAASNDNFGNSVAIDGDFAVVGARGDESSTGAAYIFQGVKSFPSLTFDGYNKLTIDNVDTVETATIKKDGAVFATTTSNTVYIRDTGTYTAEVKGSGEYAIELSKQVNTLATKPDYTNIWAGEYGGMVVDSDGKLYTWGNDGKNQSGRGASDRTPTHISTISDPVSNVWVDGAPGRTRIVKTSTDKWYMWGMNYDGSASMNKIFGETAEQSTPVDVTSDFTTHFGAQGTSDTTRIIKVVMGSTACSALAADGKVWSWGVDGNNNELGKNTTNGTASTPFKNTTDGTTELSNITDIRSLHYGKIALDSNGDVWHWGRLRTGSTGYATKQTVLNSYVNISLDSGFYYPDYEYRVNPATTNPSGFVIYQLWHLPTSTWASSGHNIRVQLSNNTWSDADSGTHPDTVTDNGTTVSGTRSDSDKQHQNPLFVFTKPSNVITGSVNIIGIGSGFFTAYAWDAAGTIYSIGQGTEGQLGNGADVDQDSTWQTVTTLQGKTIYAIYGAGYSVFAHTSDGVYACGQGTNGRLGMGNNNNLNVFTKSTTLSALSIYKLDFGHGPGYIITTDGKGYALGYDYLNSIPTPLSGDKNVPTEASSLTNLSLVYQPPAITYDGKNKLTVGGTNYEDTATVSDPNGSTYNIGTAKTMYVKDTGEYVFKISGTDKYVESNVYVSSVDLAGAPTKPIDFDGYNKLTLIDAGSNVSANVTYFSNTYELGSANVLYINGAGTYDLEMSGSNVFALSSNVVGTVSQHPTDVVPSLTFDGYNKLTLENFTTTDIEWPPSNGTWSISTDTSTVSEWTITGASYGNGTYRATSSVATNGIFRAYQAFEGTESGNTSTWQIIATAGILSIELPEPVIINKYALVNRNYNLSEDQDASPKDFTFEGSSDGSTWVVLDTVTGNGYYTAEGIASQQTFTMNNTTAYNHYRLNVTVNNGDTGTVVGELKLLVNNTRTAKLTDPNGSTYALGQTQDTIYIHQQGDYFLEVTNSDQSAVVKTDVGSVSQHPADVVPSLAFDTYNKLSIENITPISTSLRLGSNTYDIGTASNVYIEHGGTYKMATGDANTFALVSNVVSTTPTQLLEWSDTSQSVDALDTVSGDNFGISVGIDGNYAIVGAQQGDGGNGSAYIFYKSGGTWSEQAKLTASDKANNDVFGDDVDISGDYAIVASRQDDDPSNAGSVYIFKREGTTWTQKDRLRSDSPGQDDNFGDSVAISGDYAAVCSAYDDDANTNSGAIFVFKRNPDETWSRQIKLTPVSDSPAAIGEEGALNINGDYLAFGYKRYDSNRGRVYVYKRTGTEWGDVVNIDNPSDQTNSYFGQKSIAMAGDYLAAGSTNISVDGVTEAGAVYVFKRSTYSLNQVGHTIPDEHTSYYGPSDWICQSVSGTVGIYKHIYRTGIPVDSGLNTIQYDSSTSTWSDHGTGQPVKYTKNDTNWNNRSSTVTNVQAGDVIRGWKDNVNAQRGQFTHPSGSTTTWTLTASLSASDKSANAHFGSSMRMTTDTLVIGAQSVNSSQGQVYIFERSGEDWTEVKIITASDAASNHYFGHVADISGTDIIVGAYGNNKSYFFDKAYRGPELTYDTSNKLSITNLTPTSTTLTDPNGSSFDIGTASNVYIRDSGKYSIASKDANTFVLASTTVTGTPTGTTYVYDSNTFTTPSQTYDTTKTITVKNVPSTLTDVAGKIYKGSTAYTIHATTSSSNVIIKNTGTYVSVFTTATQAFLTNAIGVTTQPTTTSDDNTIEDAVTTSVDITLAFHYGSFDTVYGDADVEEAANNGRIFDDTPSGTYTWGSLDSTPSTASNQTTYTWTPSGTITADVLMVGAGGGGGNSDNNNGGGGGGGAGGLVYNSSVSLSGQKTITVGGPNSTVRGDGSSSTFTGLTSVVGGGKGGGAGGGAGNGGSGGGAYRNGTGGTGTAEQGNTGGSGSQTLSPSYNQGGSGGGGAGGAGVGATSATDGANGGAGLDYSSVFGTTYGDSGWFASGGAGGFHAGGSPGTAPNGGGGNGGASSGSAGTNGQNHTGGGGGGGSVVSGPGSYGGSGIVLVKYTTTVGFAGSTAVPDETTTDAPSVTLDATDTTVTDPTLDLDFTATLPRTLKRYNGVTNSSIGARFNRHETNKKRIEKSISIPSSFSAELTANNASSPTTLTVTVANSKFVINGDETPTLGFIRGETYTFDQSDASNSGHPLVLATSEDGTQYTTGWTASGTPGTDGSHAFIVPYDVPDTIYYKCNVHSNMGGEIHTTFGNAFSLGDFTVAANTHVSGEYTLATNYDGTTSNLYVNGDLITQITPSPAISAGVKEFILGKEFDGYVKNFKFWNRILVPKGIPYLSQIGSMSSGSWYDEGTTHLAPNIINSVAQTSGESWTDGSNVTHTIWGFDLKAGLTGAQQPDAGDGSWITFKPGTTTSNGTWHWGLPSNTAASRSGNTISIYEGSSLRARFTDTNMFVDGTIPITPNPKTMNNDT